MAASDSRPGERHAVAILGATGLVGQRFIQLLESHPWLRVAAVGASSRSEGAAYRQACTWRLPTPIPDEVAELMVSSCEPSKFSGVKIVFSALDSSVAGEIEEKFARAGFAVFTNAANHRMDEHVPILIPFVNPDHLDAVRKQRDTSKDSGFIVANANCSSTGLAVALKPLEDAFGIESLFVTTMQAISGAGYPGVPSMDIVENVVPFIKGEEAKLEMEPCKILGHWDSDLGQFVPANVNISAHCNRVSVRDGHTACVSVRLRRPTSAEQIVQTFSDFQSPIDKLQLPSAPKKAVIVSSRPDRPQPLLDRDAGNGFSVTVGRIRCCSLLDVKFVCLSHNTVLGAAGGSILNAELAIVKGLIQHRNKDA